MKRAAVLLLAGSVGTWVNAQAPEIPNGLLKPSQRDQQGSNRSYGGPPSNGLPSVTPVQQSPLPPNGLPGMSQSPPLAPLPDRKATGSVSDPAREELARYTVTAVVGEYAVLRTNVGAIRQADTNSNQPAQPMGVSAAQPSDSRAQFESQQVIRVHSGFQIMIGGILVVPIVTPFGVDFKVPGAPATFWSVSVESRSPDSRALPLAQKEALDPAVVARTAPLPTGDVAQRAGTGSAAGAVGGTPVVSH